MNENPGAKAKGPLVRVHGPALRYHRLASGIRQDDLAHAIGVSKGFLCNLEAGRKHSMRAQVFTAVAEELGIDPRLLTTNPHDIPTATPGVAA